MKLLKVTYFALMAIIPAASCTNEAAEDSVIDWTDDDIHFRTSISEAASSRALNMTLDNLASFQVTCFCNSLDKDAEGYIIPYFADATFIRMNVTNGVTYVSSPDQGPLMWPADGGKLRFYAFSPAPADMAAGLAETGVPVSDSYFRLINRSTEVNSILSADYRLSGVRVNPDISRQYDFVTAEASGERFIDFTSEIELAFGHRMSQIELRAWGSGDNYDIEIAGVRLGNPAIEGTYIFADDANPVNSNTWAKDKVNGKVEYLFSGSDDADHRDKIYLINNTDHNTQQSAQSIMGNGGCAMVIPTVNPKWEGLADPQIGIRPYTTGRMYFSILMRVSPRGGGKTMYPYPGNPDGMTVIYYAVDQSGSIISRVYPGETDDTYYTDPAHLHPYVAAAGEEIKEFGWAAVPVDADWSAGQRYVYTLNFSVGLGLHDPDDPDPGKPIAMIGTPVSWGVTVDTWHDADINDDFNPDINIP